MSLLSVYKFSGSILGSGFNFSLVLGHYCQLFPMMNSWFDHLTMVAVFPSCLLVHHVWKWCEPFPSIHLFKISLWMLFFLIESYLTFSPNLNYVYQHNLNVSIESILFEWSANIVLHLKIGFFRFCLISLVCISVQPHHPPTSMAASKLSISSDGQPNYQRVCPAALGTWSYPIDLKYWSVWPANSNKLLPGILPRKNYLISNLFTSDQHHLFPCYSSSNVWLTIW